MSEFSMEEKLAYIVDSQQGIGSREASSRADCGSATRTNEVFGEVSGSWR